MRGTAKQVYQFGSFRLDTANRLLHRDGELVALPPKVFDTLLLLVANSGEVLTKDEMMRELWPDSFVEEGTLAQYIFLLRKMLGNSAAWIENHPRRGYRFSAPVEESFEPVREQSDEERNSPQLPVAQQKQPGVEPARGSRFTAIAIILILAGVVTTSAWVWTIRKQRATSSFHSVAVLPFRTVSDSEGDHVADGITEALITRLSKLKGLRVVSYSRVRQFNGSSLDAASIGRELSVEAVIDGTVRAAAGRMRLTVHAIDTKTADTLWADDRFHAGMDELLEIEQQIAEAVARRFRGELTAVERGQIGKSGTTNAEAYELVLQARRALRDRRTAADLQVALRLLNRAIQIDPGFADAYGWLAFAQHQAYRIGEGPEMLRAAISSANHALSRDPSSLIAIRALAHIQHTTGRAVEGLMMARRALDMYPDDLEATAATAEAYFATGLSERAIPLYEKALRWEPESREFRSQLGRIYFYRGEYRKGMELIPLLPERVGSWGMTFGLLLHVEAGELDKAVRALREEQGRNMPGELTSFSVYVRGAVLAAAGDLSGARQVWSDGTRYGEALLTKNKNSSIRYGTTLAYAKLGDREKALDHLRRLLEPDPRHPLFLFWAAETHALLGNRLKALDSLRAAVENGFLNLPMIEGMARSRICTLYSLRNDAEFLAIRAELSRRVDELRARY